MGSQKISEEVITSHIFYKSIETVWNVIKDTSLVNNIISSLKLNLVNEPVLLNSNSSYEVNSTFFFYVNKHHKLLYTVKEVIETDYYFKISFKVYSSIDKDNPIIKTIHLHYLGPSTTKLTHITYTIINKAEKKEYDNVKDKEVALNKTIFAYIDRTISNKEHLKTQVEGMRFKVNIATFMKVTNNFGKGSILMDLGYQCKSFPVRSGVCINSSIINKHFSQRKFNMKLEVEFIKVNKRGMTAKINIYDIQDNSSNSSDSDVCERGNLFANKFIIAELSMINHKETYYSLRHQFYECIDKKTLLFVSQNKKYFLSKLKQVVENGAN